MTEDEAKTKWCPMVRQMSTTVVSYAPAGPMSQQYAVVPAGVGINRESNTTAPAAEYAKCIASECMMWRTFGSLTPSGYCGLAGRRDVP